MSNIENLTTRRISPNTTTRSGLVSNCTYAGLCPRRGDPRATSWLSSDESCPDADHRRRHRSGSDRRQGRTQGYGLRVGRRGGCPGALESSGEAASRELSHLRTTGSSNYREGDVTASDEEFAQRAYPGNDIPVVALQQSHSDWTRYGGRGDEGTAQWTPLGPTYAKGLPNPYRDRSVYTAGTANFSGRDAFVAIDPNCGSKGHGDDYSKSPRTTAGGTTTTTTATTNRPAACGSRTRTAGSGAPTTRSRRTRSGSTCRACSSTTTPRRSSSIRTTRAATRSGSARASRTPAAPAARRRRPLPLDRRRQPLERPVRPGRVRRPGIGSIAIQPGNSNMMFVASGRSDPRIYEHVLWRGRRANPGRPALRPLALDRRRQHWELVNQGAPRSATRDSPTRCPRRHAVLAARRAAA